MKKIGKFLVKTVSLAVLAGGAFYLLKNVINPKTEDDFEDFEDDFEDDFEKESKEVKPQAKSDNRGYVTIPIAPDAEDESETKKAEQPDKTFNSELE